MLFWTALVLSLLVIIATAVVLVRSDAWWIRIFDFPRVQLVILGLLAILCFLSCGRLGESGWYFFLVGLTAISVVAQTMKILPFTRLKRPEVIRVKEADGKCGLSILISNVLKENRNVSRLTELVNKYQPDLLLTLETDRWWEEQLSDLAEGYPYLVSHPLDNQYGMHLYSRLELVNPEVKFLIEEHIPSIHTHVRLRNGKVIGLKCLHPRPPAPTENTRTTERDAELFVAGKMVKGSDLPIIVAGDFNDVAWSHTTALFKKISGTLDPRIGRGFFNTFHAGYFFLRWPLDHVFHTIEFGLVELKRLPSIGSDHFPIYASLVLNKRAQDNQEEPDADQQEEEEAEEKVASLEDE